MDGYAYLGMESSSQRSTFVSNHKGESMQSLAPKFVHDPDPFFFWLNLVGGLKKISKCLKICAFFLFSNHQISTV
jgi:hypothetical protein